jgi:acyl-CoA synthetase (AMP-forming)/AMP-acid ligase II
LLLTRIDPRRRRYIAIDPEGITCKTCDSKCVAGTLTNVENIAAGLLSIGLSSDRPLAILSDNSIDHTLLTLAALHIGVPVTPGVWSPPATGRTLPAT